MSLCFFGHIFTLFDYQSNVSFIRRIWKYSFLSNLINELSSIIQVSIDDSTVNRCGSFLNGKYFSIGSISLFFIDPFNLFI